MLKNVASTGGDIFAPLPLSMDGLGSAENLGTWTVVVDGVARSCRLALSGSELKLIPPGLYIIFH